MWIRGDQVVLRYWSDGRMSWVEPVTVVETSRECIALYLAVDTPIKRPVQPDGSFVPRSLSYEERAALPWRLGDGHWRDNSVLWVARPGAAQAIGLFWRDDHQAFLGWYVDLQAPLKRSALGFDTENHVLDVIVAPDRAWQWKDEDEFAAAQRLGRFTPTEAAAIRAEGEAAVRAIEQRAWPFDAGWEFSRPDPSWPVPRLPAGWDAA